MIVDPTSSSASMAKDTSRDTPAQMSEAAPPPSYEAVIGNGGHFSGQYVPEGSTKAQDVKVPNLPPTEAYAATSGAGPAPPHSGPATVVYNYVNPATGERVVSLLPPDHPQMLCLQEGGHVTTSKFGLLGILAAVFWFPLGIGLCLLDRKVYCRRCGAVLDDGFC